MLLNNAQKSDLNLFFESIRLNRKSEDQYCKMEQILAFLEVIHARIRKLSRQRHLVFVDSGAGNCYLSFLIYYFYTKIDRRMVEVHCIDINKRLMDSCREKAEKFGFKGMYFHSSSIFDFKGCRKADLVYSLHACDTATDQALYLGIKLAARDILSVSCCQHTLSSQLKGHPYSGITKHRVFKNRIVYMIADSLRILLLESRGYSADVLEFVSSRYTDKNIMIRASRSLNRKTESVWGEYEKMRTDFKVQSMLEEYLKDLPA